MLNHTITLTDEEQRIARWIAHERNAANVRAGTVNRRMGPMSDADANLIGFAGELAFCRMFNVYPDFTTHIRSGTPDCHLFGFDIDVKTTRRADSPLLAIARKRTLAVDQYALMVMAWPAFTFKGFASHQLLFDPENACNVGHGADYGLDQSMLRGRLPLTEK